MNALKTAIDCFESQLEFATKLGVDSMAVTNWKKRGVPPERARDIELITTGKVTRLQLRPDIFGEINPDGA